MKPGLGSNVKYWAEINLPVEIRELTEGDIRG
jgi:hypothetical protein